LSFKLAGNSFIYEPLVDKDKASIIGPIYGPSVTFISLNLPNPINLKIPYLWCFLPLSLQSNIKSTILGNLFKIFTLLKWDYPYKDSGANTKKGKINFYIFTGLCLNPYSNNQLTYTSTMFSSPEETNKNSELSSKNRVSTQQVFKKKNMETHSISKKSATSTSAPAATREHS
jgi:hypothetical protein